MTSGTRSHSVETGSTHAGGAHDPAAQLPPVSGRTVLDCLNSARYWNAVLPEYANDMQQRADRWAIASGALSAIGGLGVWVTLMKDTRTLAQFLVTTVAFAGAIAALVPRIKNYGEMAGQARQLTTAYGRIEGQLLNAQLSPPDRVNDAMLQKIVGDFDATKASKDTNLRHLPRKPLEVKGQTVEDNIKTWPSDTYEQARKKMRPAGRPDAADG